MNALKKNAAIAIIVYAVALVVNGFTSPYIAIAIPVLGLLIALSWKQRTRKEISQPTREPELQQHPQNPSIQQQNAASTAQTPSVPKSAPAAVIPPQVLDPELASALESSELLKI